MRRLKWLSVVFIGAAASCSTTTQEPVAAQPPTPPAPPMTYATTQAEVEALRAENARLRGQLTGATHETAVVRQKNATLEAKQTTIRRGELKPGLTVQEANKAINGSTSLYKDTCRLVSQSDTQWVYRILSEIPVGGPGAGQATPLATNMRGEHAVAVEAWLCTFDSTTGKLVAFRRDAD